MAKKPVKKKAVKSKAVQKPKMKKVLAKKSKPVATTKKSVTKTKKSIAKTKKKPVISKAKAAKKKGPAKTVKKAVARAAVVKSAVRKVPPEKKPSPPSAKVSAVGVTKPAAGAPGTGMLPPPIVSNSAETPVGTITHYYSDLRVAVVRVNQNSLRVGDTIHIKGHTTDFKQPIISMEVDHKPVIQVKAGDIFGLKVLEHAREHDQLYRVNNG